MTDFHSSTRLLMQNAKARRGPAPAAVSARGDDGAATHSSPAPAQPDFDPGRYTVAEVEAYLSTVDGDERERVLEAERAGQARVSLVGH